MNIVHAVETVSRNAGGLPVAVAELAASLAKLDGENIACEILSAQGGRAIDIDEAVAVHRLGSVNAWFAAVPPYPPGTVVHQHGIWAPFSVTAGRCAKRRGLPLLLSPHGMLEPWAMAHHRWRKWLAMLAYQRRNLESADVLHATSKAEAERFREIGLTAPIAEISLGVDPIPSEPRNPEAAAAPKERRQVLFLSRIHPKKGIDLLLEAWAGLDAPEWELVIAGNDDGGHQAELEALARKLSLGRDRVRFAGPLFGAEKDTAFRRADLFVLPSHSENFGIVVPEALQYGLPVITTTGTPWHALPEEDCGWQIGPTIAALGETLANALALPDEKRRAMGERGRAFVVREHRWPAIAAKYVAVYRWISRGGDDVPAWVLR